MMSPSPRRLRPLRLRGAWCWRVSNSCLSILCEVRIMKRIHLVLVWGLWAGALGAAYGQEPPVVDAVGQQAAALEADLGKFKDSTPEAAEVMVKLADLYYRDGRLFGLVRVAEKFVASHPTDPRHSAMMLKLIDAQQGLSRNKDLAATVRQFIARYPTGHDSHVRARHGTRSGRNTVPRYAPGHATYAHAGHGARCTFRGASQ